MLVKERRKMKEKKKRISPVRRQCRECKKLLSLYNRGKYCFACNNKCFLRDERLVDDANLVVSASNNVIRFLTSPKRVAGDIRKHERIIKTQKNLIKKIEAYEYSYIPETEGHDEIIS